jgi:hypothetical protein
MPKPKLRKNNRRKIDPSDNSGRKFIYHSQIKAPDKKNISRNMSFLKQIPAIISLLAILATLFYITTLNSNPQIVIADNNSSVKFLHSSYQYQQTIKSILNKSIFNKSKFTINSNAIAKQFESDYPEFSSATVIIPISGHRLELVLKVSAPILNLQNSTGYYLLNSEGTAIIKFNTIKDMNSTKLVTLIDQSNSKVYLGKSFISSDSINFIQNIIYQYSKKGLMIQNMTLPNLPFEVDVQSRGESFTVKYNLLNSSSYQIGTYFSTEKYLKTNNLPMPSQYIDLRVPGKAFYK